VILEPGPNGAASAVKPASGLLRGASPLRVTAPLSVAFWRMDEGRPLLRDRNGIAQLRRIDSDESPDMLVHDSPSLFEALPGQSG
jgi:hypothetical protein